MKPDSDDIIELYRRNAAVWTKRRDCSDFEGERRWLDRFRQDLGGHPHVLDLGCGTGTPIATYLTETGCAVTGVDGAPELLDVARVRLPSARWIEADMRGLSLGTRFDGVLAWHSLFHLSDEDQRAMLPIFGAHSRPGAALMFTSGSRSGERIGKFEGAPLYHASLDASEYRALLAENGFDLLHHVADDKSCGGATIWLAHRRHDEANAERAK